MKPSILGMIRCPICSGKDFDYRIISEEGNEIREGQVVCKGCHKEFPVQGCWHRKLGQFQTALDTAA